jgi:hypothetical protein
MRGDEKLMYGRMLELVQGQDAGLASNAAMNLVAALIVSVSPSLEQAELGAAYAGQQIAEMVPLHWEIHTEQSGRA